MSTSRGYRYAPSSTHVVPPTAGLSKCLWRLRSLTKDSERTVNSAEEFLRGIKRLEVEADEMMLSFDVIALFTSIPPPLAIDTIDGFLQENYDGTDQQLKRQHKIELLKRAVEGDTNGLASVWINCRSGFAESRVAHVQLVPPEILSQIRR
ncbi:hypothetical protein SprV_0602235500 [Sparganum proliferum]